MDLITGINSGLGKYLYENIPNSVGLNRKSNFEALYYIEYDTIIHCAFNKETQISDYKKYLDDNILLTQRLKKLNYKKFIYISSVDVYQQNPNMYSIFKQLSETLMDEDDLILRCSMILGPTMKPNHLTKIKNNEKEIGLSGDSTFNYILMEDILEFVKDSWDYNGVIDFVASNPITINQVKKHFNSTTELGNYTYESFGLEPDTTKIYQLGTKYRNRSSLGNLKKYYK